MSSVKARLDLAKTPNPTDLADHTDPTIQSTPILRKTPMASRSHCQLPAGFFSDISIVWKSHMEPRPGVGFPPYHFYSPILVKYRVPLK